MLILARSIAGISGGTEAVAGEKKTNMNEI